MLKPSIKPTFDKIIQLAVNTEFRPIKKFSVILKDRELQECANIAVLDYLANKKQAPLEPESDSGLHRQLEKLLNDASQDKIKLRPPLTELFYMGSAAETLINYSKKLHVVYYLHLILYRAECIYLRDLQFITESSEKAKSIATLLKELGIND